MNRSALMDDGEPPTNDLQVNLQDPLQADMHVEKINTCLASSPDENENPLNGSRDKVMGIVEQDSINNNEGEDHGVCAPQCQESLSDKLSRSSSTDEMLIPEARVSENRSPRKTKSCIKKDTKRAKHKKTDVAATDCMQEEGGNKTNSNCSQKDPTQTLQTLFSLLREAFEQMDSRVLPLCLHQIAETYFQDGEYEKAMKFIQLEQLYHEQLLANLSSIQQQWETKWKATASSEVPGLKNSAKGLNNEELDKLAELCTSHQEPLVPRSKLISEEKPWTHNSFIGFTGSADSEDRGAATCDSDTETWAGIGSRPEHHHSERERRDSFQPDSRHTLSKRARLQLAVREGHMEEEHRSAESGLESPTQSPGAPGTLRSGCLSSREAGEDNSLQLREEQFSEDVSKIEAAAEEPAAESSSEPMVDTLVLTDADYMPCDLISTGDNVRFDGNGLPSNPRLGSSAVSSGHLGSRVLNQQQPVCKNDSKSVPCRTLSDIRENVFSESNTPEQAAVGYAEVSEGVQETTELEEEGESKGSEDFFQQFLNGCIKDREESIRYLATLGDSDTLSHIPTEQALYSSSEDYSREESFSSLDELAKRIEIAENVPAEGLVSILKKRDDSESKDLAQIQQRQAKRRVRFQEMEDSLDQEEVGGGSCVLLVLLCIATVFLSVGGTALYCTFGDTESPVCTDFAANMDFYCTQILQGIEELKHWISLS
uniref:consortin n=1 Tax=Euleptes europaea TaxID=460621 RepID=UPI00253F737A|nr:consortin [Euleptes europaea]